MEGSWDERVIEPVAAALRRIPQQRRSVDRVLGALEAADHLLATEGAAALTTTRIAEAAGMSVGSLYQYFPDRQTIVEALAIAYWSDLLDLVEGVAEAEERTPRSDPLDAAFDALAAGIRARPGFRALWFGGLRTERVRDVTRPGREQVTRAVERILAAGWPGTAERRATVARMVVLAGDGLLREAFRLDPAGDEGVLAESKQMLNAYVSDALGARSG